MARIEEKDLEFIVQQGIETKKDNEGNVVAFKGPWLPHWYDDRGEMMRENQAERNRLVCAKQGLNEYGQTKEQQAQMEKTRKVLEQKRLKAEMAAEMALQNK